MINKLTNLPTPILGGGYSTDMQMASLEPCLNTSNTVYSRGDKVTIITGNSRSYSQIQDILGVFTQIALFSDDTQSLYAANIQDNKYSQSYHFYEQLYFPTQTLLPIDSGANALTTLGQNIYNSGMEQFRQQSSEQFFSQMQSIKTLFSSSQLVFASLSEEVTFDNTINTFDFAGLYEAIIGSQKIVGEVHLTAYQICFTCGDLEQIFVNNSNDYTNTSTFLESNEVSNNGLTNSFMCYAPETSPEIISFPVELTAVDSGIF